MNEGIMNVLKRTIQPEVLRQTKKVAVVSLGELAVMWSAFYLLSAAGCNVPFDISVIAGGAAGTAVAVLSFFMMGLTVQGAVAETNEDNARMKMKAGYSNRMMLRVVWGALAFMLPCLNFVAAVLPLLFPNTGIKLFYKWMAS